MKNTYYFIAIGGIGMSGLAKYLLEAGEDVQGSDIKRNRNIEELEKLGAKIHIGHDESNLPENCIVIASTAIRESNPELKKARKLGLEILHRSDMLAKISKGLSEEKKKYFLGFSGTHGKTTTSGLAAYVLQKANLSPSFVVGGIVPEFGINSNAGKGNHFVAELDESDGTIVKYAPEISIINNLEIDHLDFYEDGLQAILNTFKLYLSNLSENATVIINNDNEGNKKLIEQNPNVKFTTFGLENADYMAKNIKLESDTTFEVYYKGEFLISIKTQMAGVHNVYNTLAVIASLHKSEVDLEVVKPHLYTFTGMGRRLQKTAEFSNITIFDDYAHHPTEIKATLAALKSRTNNRVIAVFQPHRYTRLKGLWDNFLKAFKDADMVYVTDVYAASEDEIVGINGDAFAKDLISYSPCEYLKGSIQDVAGQLIPKLKPTDTVVGLGAGTITTLGKDLEALKNEVKA
ncbi:MAG: UDP-N-acetylmuramate--L-alanine ligase [bacterium]|nr:UDP-N-acetylmuramate--L-alanine ligase [bacterium]